MGKAMFVTRVQIDDLQCPISDSSHAYTSKFQSSLLNVPSSPVRQMIDRTFKSSANFCSADLPPLAKTSLIYILHHLTAPSADRLIYTRKAFQN